MGKMVSVYHYSVLPQVLAAISEISVQGSDSLAALAGWLMPRFCIKMPLRSTCTGGLVSLINPWPMSVVAHDTCGVSKATIGG